MEEMDLQFFTRFNEAKKMFIMVSNQAKKEIILQDEDDFIESMADQIKGSHGLSGEDAENYSKIIYGIWEDCGCSMTAFDRKMKEVREELFP